MKKSLSLPTVLFLFTVAALGQQTDISSFPTISVTGTAEIHVVPDTATFTLRIIKSDKELTVAKRQNDDSLAKLSELTRKFAIKPTDVKTDFISVKEKFNRVKLNGDDEYMNVFAGYTVSRTMIIRLRDLKQFEEFFAAVVQTGVTEVGGVAFESTDLRTFKDRARAMAIRAAREKAEAIVKEIGQTIGKAVSLVEEDVDGFRSPYANTSVNSFSIDGEGSDDSNAIGTISVKAQIKAAFLLN